VIAYFVVPAGQGDAAVANVTARVVVRTHR
jgi:hypothetical protein